MANPPGPHVHMLAGDSHEVYGRLREEIGSDERGAAMIAGAYSRPLMMQNANFFVQTESELNVVDLQTHSLFVDIRIPTDRLRTGAGSMAEMSPQALQDLARCHCFAGYSVVDYDIEGYEGLPVCNRLHCIDWAPIDGEKNNNQWRVQPVWDKGGWVELGVLKDEFCQAAYVEHWETLPGTREGPFLALRRAAGHGRDAILVVAGSRFGYIVDRPAPLLATGELRTTARLVAAELAAATGDSADAAAARRRAEAMLDMECSVGAVGGGWEISRSTFPWLEGTELLGGTRSISLNLSGGTAVVTTAAGSEEWEIFENVGVDEDAAQRLFGGDVARL